MQLLLNNRSESSLIILNIVVDEWMLRCMPWLYRYMGAQLGGYECVGVYGCVDKCVARWTCAWVYW